MANVKANVSGIGYQVGRIVDLPDATTALMDAIADEERKALQRKVSEAEHSAHTLTWKQDTLIKLHEELRVKLEEAEEQRDTYRKALDDAVKLHNAKVDENSALQAEMRTKANVYVDDLVSAQVQINDLTVERSQLKAKLQATESAASVLNTPKPSRLERFWRAITGSP